MDIWHSANPGVAAKAYDPLKATTGSSTGWLGRTLDQARKAAGRKAGQDVPAMYLGANELPLALAAGETAVPSFDSLESFRLQTGGGALAPNTLRGVAAVSRDGAPPLTDFVRRSMLTA